MVKKSVWHVLAFLHHQEEQLGSTKFLPSFEILYIGSLHSVAVVKRRAKTCQKKEFGEILFGSETCCLNCEWK